MPIIVLRVHDVPVMYNMVQLLYKFRFVSFKKKLAELKLLICLSKISSLCIIIQNFALGLTYTKTISIVLSFKICRVTESSNF